VSDPDMRSAAEARAYLQLLKQILEYANVSDVNMEEGSLRVDANVSARLQGEKRLGTKTEIKNLNSFSGVERALEAEFARQCAVLASGGVIEQQTMLWDAPRWRVRPARSKEGSHDYRYFPEPDLPPLALSRHRIDRIRGSIPELPSARRARFAADYGLGAYDAEVLTASVSIADYYEELARASGDPKTSSNWVQGEVLAALKTSEGSIAAFPVRPEDLAELLGLVRDGVVSHTAAKQIFALMQRSGERATQIAEREGLVKVSDDVALVQWLEEVLAEHPTETQRLAAGEKKLQGVIVGLVMKRSGGRADPKRLNQLLGERFGR
jgi:aspartyl-tRNA(Asn)/glutamyl-tRNA(Gln) amidotransferase subunit B